MESTSTISNSDLVFYRRLRRNLVFSEVLAYFASLAAREGLTKRKLGQRIGRDASLITRWFSEPSNLNLDTISDLLTGMGAEMDFRVIEAGEQLPEADLMADFEATSSDQYSVGSHSISPATETNTSVWLRGIPQSDVSYGEQQGTG